jgi:hypothetical protein
MNWQKASGYNRRPTKEQRNDVRALASYGTAQDVIARYLRISTHTLRLPFRDELDSAAIKANQAMTNNLFRNREPGHRGGPQSRLNYRAHWRESSFLDLAVHGGGISGLPKAWGLGIARRVREFRQNPTIGNRRPASHPPITHLHFLHSLYPMRSLDKASRIMPNDGASPRAKTTEDDIDAA